METLYNSMVNVVEVFIYQYDGYHTFLFHSLPARGWRSLKGALHRKESHHIM